MASPSAGSAILGAWQPWRLLAGRTQIIHPCAGNPIKDQASIAINNAPGLDRPAGMVNLAPAAMRSVLRGGLRFTRYWDGVWARWITDSDPASRGRRSALLFTASLPYTWCSVLSTVRMETTSRSAIALLDSPRAAIVAISSSRGVGSRG